MKTWLGKPRYAKRVNLVVGMADDADRDIVPTAEYALDSGASYRRWMMSGEELDGLIASLQMLRAEGKASRAEVRVTRSCNCRCAVSSADATLIWSDYKLMEKSKFENYGGGYVELARKYGFTGPTIKAVIHEFEQEERMTIERVGEEEYGKSAIPLQPWKYFARNGFGEYAPDIARLRIRLANPPTAKELMNRKRGPYKPRAKSAEQEVAHEQPE